VVKTLNLIVKPWGLNGGFPEISQFLLERDNFLNHD
jgi:hypothetical protein